MAIAKDASTPVPVDNQASASATAVTASFSPPAGSLVAVAVVVCLQGTSATNTVTVADSLSNSYTAGPSVWAFSANGVFFFTRYYATAPGSITVTATRSATTAALFEINTWVLTGAASDQTGHAAPAGTSGNTTSETGSITTTAAGSWALCAIGCNNVAPTVSGLTEDQHHQDSTDGAMGAAGHAITGTPGATTIGWTSVTAFWTWAALEILPAAAAAGGVGPAQPGQTWLRRFHHRQQLPPAPSAPPSGPPVYPLQGPVKARAQRAPRGHGGKACGKYSGTGPPVRVWRGPVQAKPRLARPGRVTRAAGTWSGTGPPVPPLRRAVRPQPVRRTTGGDVTRAAGRYSGSGPQLFPLLRPVTAAQRTQPPRGRVTSTPLTPPAAAPPTSGPPVYPWQRPVQAQRPPARGGHVARAAGVFSGAGPALSAPHDPVTAAQRTPPRRGRITVTPQATPAQVTPGTGPPLTPWHAPAAARRLPARGGRVTTRRGMFSGTGPPVTPMTQPCGHFRRRPPPARGHGGHACGRWSGTGPPVRAWHAPVAARLPRPFLAGRHRGTVTPSPAVTAAPGSTGVLTASTAPGSTLSASQTPGATLGAADKAASAQTASTQPGSSIIATTQKTGGPG